MNTDRFKVQWPDHSSNVKSLFYKWYQTGYLTDVTIYADGQSLRVHKFVLAAFSRFFNGVFQDPKRQATNFDLYFEDVPFESVQKLVDYMYTGDIIVGRQFVKVCLLLADSWQIHGLAEILNDTLITEPMQVSEKMHEFIENVLPTIITQRSETVSSKGHKEKKKKKSRKNAEVVTSAVFQTDLFDMEQHLEHENLHNVPPNASMKVGKSRIPSAAAVVNSSIIMAKTDEFKKPEQFKNLQVNQLISEVHEIKHNTLTGKRSKTTKNDGRQQMKVGKKQKLLSKTCA